MSGFSIPSVIQGEVINGYTSDADEFRNFQPGKDTIRDFSTGTSYPGNINPILDQFVEGIPLPRSSINTLPTARYSTIENPDNFSTAGSFDYPLEFSKNIVPSDYNMMNSSCGTMKYVCNDLPFDTSGRWDLSKSITSPELGGIVIPRPTGNSTSNGWILPESGSLTSNSPGSSLFSNELSLSLATSRPSVVHYGSVQEPCLAMSSAGLTSYCLHQRHIGSEQTSCNSNNFSLSSNSSKPVEISHLLLGSRYFHVMQEILAEIARIGFESFDQTSYSTTWTEDRINAHFSLAGTGRGYSEFNPSDYPDRERGTEDRGNRFLQDREVETKKKHLLALLQVADDRLNQCLDEIHTVVSAFHAVTELDHNIHARFALPTISFLYKNLRERISRYILAMGANFSEGRETEEKSFEASFIEKQWALQQLKKRDHPLWRPQRGLPERSVSILRAWMFQNFLHPYPKDAEKHLLALKSGLTRSQVSNWFINARVRLWKPMIEEMYTEMNRRKGLRNDEGTDSNCRNHMFFENTRFKMN